MIWVVYQIFCD